MAKAVQVPDPRGFLEEVLAASGPTKRCGLYDFISTQSEDAQESMWAAVDHSRVSVQALVNGLKKYGYQFDEYPIRKHRNKRCSCFRKESI